MRFEKSRIILILLALFFLLTGLAAVASADGFIGTIKSIGHVDAGNLKIVVTDEEGNDHTITVLLTEGENFNVGDDVKVTEGANGVKILEKIEEENNEINNEINNKVNNEENVAVPEFPTIALPMLAVFGLVAIFGTRNKKA